MEFLKTHKVAIQIGGFIAVALVVCLLGLYLTSSSKVSVPKADQQANIAAQANANSEVHLTEANSLANQANQAQTDVNTSRVDYKQASDKARQRKRYDEVRKDPVTVSDRDLDKREHDVLTKLRKLYWQQPK